MCDDSVFMCWQRENRVQVEFAETHNVQFRISIRPALIDGRAYRKYVSIYFIPLEIDGHLCARGFMIDIRQIKTSPIHTFLEREKERETRTVKREVALLCYWN